MTAQKITPAGGPGRGREIQRNFEQIEDIPTAPARQEICFDCAYFRAVRLSVRLRTFCRLSGEKLRPDTPACRHWPGSPENARGDAA